MAGEQKGAVRELGVLSGGGARLPPASPPKDEGADLPQHSEMAQSKGWLGSASGTVGKGLSPCTEVESTTFKRARSLLRY